MSNFIRKYRQMPSEKRNILKIVIGLCFSTVLACGKLVIGLFSDYNLISIAVYTFGILLAKLECVLGLKTNQSSLRQRNTLAAAFLFLSSVFYIGFMCRMFFIERQIKNQSMVFVLLLALISFTELGFAVAGLVRANQGHFDRNIKIINFCVALIAILTTQTSILNMNSQTGTVHMSNAYSGIGVGIFIALCAVYILFAPKISVLGREHHVFKLADASQNHLIDMNKESVKILLSRSSVHGSFVYRAIICDGRIDGKIEREQSLWKRMHLVWKIICCILSEILLFVWLISRLLFFFRSINLPKRLENQMKKNGFDRQACK